MASKQPGDIWIAVTYDGKFTGSTEHRQYNHGTMANALRATDPAIFSPIGTYAHAYDIGGGKSKEPNFDGILAYVAILSDEVFDENFHYWQTIYEDGPQPDALYSGLSTSLLPVEQGGRRVNRAELAGIFGSEYALVNHVFVLGPVSQNTLNVINGIQGHCIFHLQGDANSRRGNEHKTTSYPDAMTVYEGLFPIAFNLWTGEELARQLRALFTGSFTVKCNPDIVVDEALGKNLTAPPAEPPALQIAYPRIFAQICQTIFHQEYLNPPQPLVPGMTVTPVNVLFIAEDLIDKDNLTACSILIKNSRIRPALSLIGRRVYDTDPARSRFNPAASIFKTIALPNLTEPPGTFVPTHPGGAGVPQPGLWPWIAPCVPVVAENGAQVMTEVQFPAVRPGFPAYPVNQRFNPELTLRNHELLCGLFLGVLNASRSDAYNYTGLSTDDIVDGMGVTSTSLRSPFHENMIFKGGIVGDALRQASDQIEGRPPAFGGRRKNSTRNKKSRKHKKYSYKA
jgi:hypothetical protein